MYCSAMFITDHVRGVFPSAAPAQQVFQLAIRFLQHPRRCMTSRGKAVRNLVPVLWQVGGRSVQTVKNVIRRESAISLTYLPACLCIKVDQVL